MPGEILSALTMNQSVKIQPWVLSATLSQSGKVKRHCRKQAQILGETWFVSEELKAGKASSCAPGTRSAHMSRPRVPGFQQCVPAGSCSSMAGGMWQRGQPWWASLSTAWEFCPGQLVMPTAAKAAMRRHQ